MLSRGGDAWLWKHPGPISSAQTVECGDGDTAVAFDCGALLGSYGAGRHAIAGSAVDLYFVRPRTSVKLGTQVATRSGNLRVFGEVELRVSDPVKLLAGAVVGMGAPDPHAGLERYVQQQIASRLSPALARASLDEPGITAALGSIDPAIMEGLEIERFVQLTVNDASGGTITVRPSSGPAPGATVWAYWTDGNWYPATVREVDTGGVLIQWDSSNNTARLPLSHLKPRQG